MITNTQSFIYDTLCEHIRKYLPFSLLDRNCYFTFFVIFMVTKDVVLLYLTPFEPKALL